MIRPTYVFRLDIEMLCLLYEAYFPRNHHFLVIIIKGQVFYVKIIKKKIVKMTYIFVKCYRVACFAFTSMFQNYLTEKVIHNGLTDRPKLQKSLPLLYKKNSKDVNKRENMQKWFRGSGQLNIIHNLIHINYYKSDLLILLCRPSIIMFVSITVSHEENKMKRF